MHEHDALQLLAAMAFEMVLDGNFEGIEHGPPFENFKNAVWNRLKQDANRWPTFEAFIEKLDRLGEVNEFLDFGFMEGTGLRQIYWRNRSLQEFFAGLWLARFAPPQDVDEMIGKQGLFDPDNTSTRKSYWTWRFAAEMPAAARSSERWVTSMAPFYKRPVNGQLRMTEMIYRSHQTMQRAKCGTEGENDVTYVAYRNAALNPYQDEFRKICRAPSMGGRILLILLWCFGIDVPSFRRLRIAHTLVAMFRRIPKDMSYEMSFTMASPAEESNSSGRETEYEAELDRPFEMACCQVTNCQFELFDEARVGKRGRRSSEDRTPVLFVSWYDAFAFALWLGDEYGLPTEKEWEYACRAGTTTAYHTGDSLPNSQAQFGRDSIRSTYDHFRNYHTHGNVWEVAPPNDLLYDARGNVWELGRTSVVGSYPPNGFGLYDMHGNVDEWCATWYHDDVSQSDRGDDAGSERVIRGGSWEVSDLSCRSASRSHRKPWERDRTIGFRLVRRGI